MALLGNNFAGISNTNRPNQDGECMSQPHTSPAVGIAMIREQIKTASRGLDLLEKHFGRNQTWDEAAKKLTEAHMWVGKD